MKRVYCTLNNVGAVINRENKIQARKKVFYNIRVQKYTGAKNYDFVVIIG